MRKHVIRCVVIAAVFGGSTDAVANEPPRWDRFDQFLLPSVDATDPLEPDLLVRGQQSVFSEPLSTDRPDFTEASNVVGRNVLQMETGYTFVYDDNELDNTLLHSHGGPEMLLRYGITEAIELRLFWNYIWQRTIDSTSAVDDDGADDLVLGTKLYLNEQNGLMPESALILAVSAPTGGRAFTSGKAEMAASWLYSWELPNEWSLGGSTGYATQNEMLSDLFPFPLTSSRDNHNVFAQSIALGVPLSDKWGSYIEYFGFYTDGLAADFSQHFIDGGFTYLVNYNLQLDVRAGTGLNDASEDLFAGVGLSYRR